MDGTENMAFESSGDIHHDGEDVVNTTLPYQDGRSNIDDEMIAGFRYQENAGNNAWRVISMACGAYVLIIFIIDLAFDITAVFATNTHAIDEVGMMIFELYMFCLAAVGVNTFLTLAVSGKLTKSDHFKDRQKTSFVRGGMIVLGSGTVIYSCIVIIEEAWVESTCRNTLRLASETIRLIYLLGEMAFIYAFTRIRINRSPIVAMCGRLMVAHLIVSNMCIWLTIVIAETLHELEEAEHASEFELSYLDPTEYRATTVYVPTEAEGTNDTSVCTKFNFLRSLSPYLFPLVIEYCVLIGCMWLSVWENCGICIASPNKERSSIQNHLVRSTAQIVNITVGSEIKFPVANRVEGDEKCRTEKKSDYKNSGLGFILGWMTIVSSIFCVLVFMYWILSDTIYFTEETVISLSYGSNMGVSGMIGIAVPVIIYQMRALPTQVESHKSPATHTDEYSTHMGHKLDMRLLGATSTAVLIFKMLCIIAAFNTGQTVIAADGFICMFTVMLQTGFIKTYASVKICTTNHQRKHKPGRQGLEFLRCANFSLWLINTFVLKDNATKMTQSDVFGRTVWVVISNIFQPLTILYYFHSMICVADVITDVYSEKNIATVVSSTSAHGHETTFPANAVPASISPRLDSSHRYDTPSIQESDKHLGSPL